VGRNRAIGAQSVGALAVGAMALGALAFGVIAIGRLAIGRARIRRLEIDELIVGRLRVTDALDLPAEQPRDTRCDGLGKHSWCPGFVAFLQDDGGAGCCRAVWQKIRQPDF